MQAAAERKKEADDIGDNQCGGKSAENDPETEPERLQYKVIDAVWGTRIGRKIE